MNNESAFLFGARLSPGPMSIPALESIVRYEPNLDCSQHKYKRSYAENLGSLCFMVYEKIESRTDGQTQLTYKRLFFLGKKGLNSKN